MDTNCYQCSKPIKSLEFMQCSGFCNQAAHLKCVSLKRPSMDFVNEHCNLLWFCDKCIDLLKFVRNKPMTTEDLHETKQLTKSLTEKLHSNDFEPNREKPVWPRIKRTRDKSERETPRAHPSTKLVSGTKSVEKQTRAVETVPKPPEKFWIYLSRIARHVTEDDVSELVKSCLQTEQSVDVRKLVRKDADLNQYAFISFKIGVDLQLKETALDPSIWPKGIYFREFESQETNKDFWVPAKHPRIGEGTPVTASTQ
ncbi:uncharacterized protein LOC129775724 [Toxorhynchites rutilus septentrionalis]|uniref:uncharacterized protein LOC129775724 n=1 Tax=Toxorhynchites rutilus septentrionalis TaxID=329112 RepID=UPI0024787F59|nr:uncharacterized protein LOC129775724 [Toxorhynchites rutilus septentrionalis]